MSEQSGGDPITREQVERLLADMHEDHGMWHVIADALGEDWLSAVPMDVRLAWQRGEWGACIAALTRWRDELVAAEPVRRVARWDAERQRYMLTPPATTSHQYNPSTADRETASAWGYEIEGGPGPVAHHAASERVVERLRAMTPAEGLAALVDAGIVTPDGELTEAYSARPEPAEDSPERLRERREALGWDLAQAAEKAGWHMDDIHALEGVCPVPAGVVCKRCPEARVDYAAALSAEEARRATVAAECCAECGYLFGALTGDDGPGDAPVVRSTGKPDTCTNCAPERPAPRFKVGDWVRVCGTYAMYWGTAYQIVEIVEGWHRSKAGSGECSYAETELEPASPPAPEVVDVPQPAAPVVKRCDTVTASWTPGKGHLTVRTMARDMDVPIALLRAMLEAIDAQQGGAS